MPAIFGQNFEPSVTAWEHPKTPTRRPDGLFERPMMASRLRAGDSFDAPGLILPPSGAVGPTNAIGAERRATGKARPVRRRAEPSAGLTGDRCRVAGIHRRGLGGQGLIGAEAVFWSDQGRIIRRFRLARLRTHILRPQSDLSDGTFSSSFS
jgi:hypothetical protein